MCKNRLLPLEFFDVISHYVLYLAKQNVVLRNHVFKGHKYPEMWKKHTSWKKSLSSL